MFDLDIRAWSHLKCLTLVVLSMQQLRFSSSLRFYKPALVAVYWQDMFEDMYNLQTYLANIRA